MAGRTSTTVITQREILIGLVAVVVGAWAQIVYIGTWDSVWALVYKYQSLLTWVPILAAAAIAYLSIQKQIKETNARFENETHQRRIRIAGLYAAVSKFAAEVFNTNAEILEKSPGLHIDTVSLAPYEKLLKNLSFLPVDLSTLIIGLFEHLRIENPIITDTNKSIQDSVANFQKASPNATEEELHKYIRKIFKEELAMYVLVQWDNAQVFYSLSAWLEYEAGGGEELSKEAAQKRFGKLGLFIPQPIASDEEYHETLARVEGLKNAKEGTAEFCALKVLSILIAQYEDI